MARALAARKQVAAPLAWSARDSTPRKSGRGQAKRPPGPRSFRPTRAVREAWIQARPRQARAGVVSPRASEPACNLRARRPPTDAHGHRARRAAGAQRGRVPKDSGRDEEPRRECRHDMPTCQARASCAYLHRPMPMSAKQLRTALKRLGLTQVGAAARLGMAPRTMRYWVAGERRIPEPVAILLRTWLKERRQHQ